MDCPYAINYLIKIPVMDYCATGAVTAAVGIRPVIINNHHTVLNSAITSIDYALRPTDDVGATVTDINGDSFHAYLTHRTKAGSVGEHNGVTSNSAVYVQHVRGAIGTNSD